MRREKKTLGRLSRGVRRRSLLTLENLAGASGVSVRAISDMERGQSLPRRSTLSELMDALGLDEDQRRRLVQASVRRVERVPGQLPPALAVFRGRAEALTTVHGFTPGVAARGGDVVVAAVGGWRAWARRRPRSTGRVRSRIVLRTASST